MLISSTRINAAQPKTAAPKKQVEIQNESSSTPESQGGYKDIVTKGAYATGGALGGVGLGVVTGQVLSNLTGTPVFAKVGGVAGAVAGAATALSASNAENTKEALTKSFMSWTGSSLGSAGGMLALGAAGAALSANGAASLFASQGQLIGAATGGLIGAAIPLAHSEEPAAVGIQKAALGAFGASAGLYLGGAAQTLLSSIPGLAHAAIPVPGILATTGALNMVNRHTNSEARGYLGWEDDKVEYANPTLAHANQAALGTSVGYGVGLGIAALATEVLGGSALYNYAAPATGALVGGLKAYGVGGPGLQENKSAEKAATLVGFTGAGVLAGDALGHGLAFVTGHDIYRNLGPLAGGANAFAVTGNELELGNKFAASSLTGAVAGTSAGALMGAGLGALTGQTIWGKALPVLGGVAGVLTGVAMTLNSPSE